MKLQVFEQPTNKDEAYQKWKVACKMLLLLQAADLVEEKKIEQAHDLATSLD